MKLISVIISAIFTVSSICFAQMTEIRNYDPDSLKRELDYRIDNSIKDSSTIELFNQLARYYMLSDPKHALYYNDKALELFKDSKKTIYIGNIYNLRGNIFFYTGNYEQALSSYNMTLKISLELDELGAAAYSLNDIGFVYHKSGLNEQALDKYDLAYEMFVSRGDDVGSSHTLNNIGVVYRSMNNYDSALIFFKRSLNMRLKHGYPEEIAQSYQYIAFIYELRQQYDTSLDYYNKAIKVQEDANYRKRMLAYSYMYRGLLYNEMGKFAEAEKDLLTSLQLFKNYESMIDICDSYMQLAYLKQRMGNNDQVLSYAEEAFNLARKNSILNRIVLSGKFLAEQYSARKQYQQAYHVSQIVNDINDTLLSLDKSKIISEIEVNKGYAIDKLNKRIDELEKHSEKDDYMLYIIFVVVFLILLALLTVKIRQSKKQTKIIAELNSKNEVLFHAFTSEIKELKHNKEMIDRLLSLAKISFIKWNYKTDLAELSDYVYQKFDIPKDDKINMQSFLQQTVHPEDREYAKRELEKIAASETAYPFECRMLNRAGQSATMIIISRIERDTNNDKLLCCLIWDVSDEKKLIAEITETKDHLNALLASTQRAILIIDKDKKIILTNNNFLKMWDLPERWAEIEDKKELVTLVARQVANPGEFAGSINKLLANPKDVLLDEIHFKDGRIIERLSKPFYSGGKIIARYNEYFDITERRKYEDVLKENEKRLSLVLSAHSSGYFDIFFEPYSSSMNYCNTEFAKLFGYELDELRPLDSLQDWWIRHVHEKDRNTLMATYQKFKEGKKSSLVTECRVRTKDGSQKYISMHLKAIERNKFTNEAKRIIGIFIDISDSKEKAIEREGLIQELKHSNEVIEHKNSRLTDINDILKASEKRLKQLNATKDKFFSIISHDLRNPIAAFFNSTKVLNQMYDKLDEDEIKLFLEELYDSSKLLFALMENLLEWSRAQIGSMHVAKTEINLYYITENVIDITKPNAKAKHIAVHNEIAPDILVFTDSNILHTVLRNLISNAIKFTPEGGMIYISAEQINNKIHVSIKDTGIGMSEEYQKKLFKIESSSSRNGTNSEKGTGLGLILCKEFLSKTEGKIWVNSTEGEGTTFTFSLAAISKT